MGKYQGYEKYKDSGVEWLGEIPEHWKAVRIKHITNQIIDGAHFTPTYVNEGIPFLRVTDIVQAKNNSINMNNIKFIPEEEHNTLSIRCKPEKGDLLYSKNGTIGVPRIVDWDFDFSIFVSLCLIKVIKPKVNIEFLQYSLLGKLTETQINIGAKSNTVTNLHLDKIKEFWATLPPLDEQKTIARFLDHKTKQIDDLIAKKETLIEKLDEKRTALISHAVTKGLDPSVPMKDSGVEWLGQIPEHWEVKKTKFLVTKIGSGKTPKGGSEIYVDSGVMLIRSQNVYDEGLRLDDVVYIDDEIDNLQANSRVFPNDILLNITGASIGRVGLVPPGFGKANVNQHVCIFRPNLKEILPQYLHLLLCSQEGKQQIFSYENGTSREGLNFQQAGNLTFTIPSIDIQKQITEYLDITTAKLDKQKSKIQEAIKLLKEYRTALITNAVTGKIDVRQVSIR
ncbi:MAG: restriction endonuclease subunit S [Brasilonema angustatum HA4187-MV1]|jgi:type I restriction enzyme S subunit|nr:restriction endonuclease subunit S [Brasilonema angustatum HA4187-MV1]